MRENALGDKRARSDPTMTEDTTYSTLEHEAVNSLEEDARNSAKAQMVLTAKANKPPREPRYWLWLTKPKPHKRGKVTANLNLCLTKDDRTREQTLPPSAVLMQANDGNYLS